MFAFLLVGVLGLRNSSLQLDKQSCFESKSGLKTAQICLLQAMTAGVAAGAVYRGTIDGKKCIVKFNEVKAESQRDLKDGWHVPASSNDGEVEALTAMYGSNWVPELLWLIRGDGRSKTAMIDNHKVTLPGMVMEYIDGITAFDYLEKGPGEARTRFYCVARQLFRAAVGMLSAGFMHMDLHLGNILVTDGKTEDTIATLMKGQKCPRIKVIDFGMVRKVSSLQERFQALEQPFKKLDKMVDDFEDLQLWPEEVDLRYIKKVFDKVSFEGYRLPETNHWTEIGRTLVSFFDQRGYQRNR